MVMKTEIADNNAIGNNLKTKLPKAILGGFLGTVALSLLGRLLTLGPMGHFAGPRMAGQPMDVPALIAASLGVPLVIGLVVHFVNGTIIFPVVYLLTVYRWVRGSAGVRGIIFGFCAYLAAMTILIPAMGHGPFFGNGSKAIVALITHLVFGAILGLVTGKPSEDEQ